MPKPFGVSGRIEGTKIILEASNGQNLLNKNLYVRMASTRSSSLSDALNIPDDSIEIIFNNVIGKLKDRLMLPKDTIIDDNQQGAKNK